MIGGELHSHLDCLVNLIFPHDYAFAKHASGFVGSWLKSNGNHEKIEKQLQN
jgi:hypothetical protein